MPARHVQPAAESPQRGTAEPELDRRASGPATQAAGEADREHRAELERLLRQFLATERSRKPEGSIAPELDLAALQRFLAERLPPVMLPSRYVLLPELPRTLSGKVDRKALPDATGVRPPGLGQAFVPPRTDLERELAGLFAEVLRLERVSPLEDFFALGGHSMRALELVRRVRERHGVGLRLLDFMRNASVRALAEHIERAAKDRAAPTAAAPAVTCLWLRARTSRGVVDAGSATLLALPGERAPIVLTALHNFGPAGGLSEQMSSKQLAQFVSEVEVTDPGTGSVRYRANRALRLPGTAPLGTPSLLGDVAAFEAEPGASDCARLPADTPVPPGAPVWLGCVSESADGRALPAQLLDERGGYLRYRISKSVGTPLRSSGAPLLDAQGRLLGVHVGLSEDDPQAWIGMASPLGALCSALKLALRT